MDIKVKGGKILSGKIDLVANKNSVLPAIAASLLTVEDVVYKNIPKTTDVNKMLEILESIGATVNKINESDFIINTKNVNSYKIDARMGAEAVLVGSTLRTSILFVGPLLARFKKAVIPLPGGCTLGARSIHAHIDLFIKAGCDVEIDDEFAYFTSPRNDIETHLIWPVLESSVTATENLLMYACASESTINIRDAASEPHVLQLSIFLQNMGAKIEGIGSNNLTITGKNNLHGAEFSPEFDHIDFAGCVILAAVTKSNLTIKNCGNKDLTVGILQVLTKFGINYKYIDNDLVVNATTGTKAELNSGLPMANSDTFKILPRPWPGYPADAIPALMSLCLVTNGKFILNNWMYENPYEFVPELNKLGAGIEVTNKNIAFIKGAKNLNSGTVTAPKVIEGAKALLLSALASRSQTIIKDVDILTRRYPNIFKTYVDLGADIEILN